MTTKNSPGRLSYPIGEWSLNLIMGLIDILECGVWLYLVVLGQVEQFERRGRVEKESRKEIVATPSLRLQAWRAVWLRLAASCSTNSSLVRLNSNQQTPKPNI